MAIVERFRHWYEHEKASDKAMLTMIESVPNENRMNPKFKRAVALADHLVACRENWLIMLTDSSDAKSEWWSEGSDLALLPARFDAIEAKWTDYLASLTDERVTLDFECQEGPGRLYWNIEGQIVQLFGHAPYHRGQIAMLVDELGGETVDTDYADWEMGNQSDRWKWIPDPT